jgi:hypothetical protein
MSAREFFNEDQNGKISLNNYAFKIFLENNQFSKHKPNDNSSFNLIKKDGIFLKIKDDWEIKDFVLDFIIQNKLGEKAYNLMTSKGNIFKRDFLSMLQLEDLKILKDRKDTSYLMYQNGVLEINKNEYKLKDYKEFGVYVWEEQVIKRNYIDSDHHECEYRTFIWLISGGFDLPENATVEQKHKYELAVKRYNSFQSVIGYLLHSYNDNENKAIILNDEAISEDPNGRSGKGIFWNALSHLKKVQSLNGKSFDFNSAFPYQGVKTDCQVLVWDDVRKNFDFENLFSVITEGIEITYKGKDTIKLSIKDSPKILITTNYTIKGKGGSHEDRRFELELSSFFNSSYKPIDYFGHKLFTDWDDKEWSKFDSYMVQCLTKYLNNGLVPYEQISLPLKKFQLELTTELYNCISALELNEWHTYEKFYNNYVDSVKRNSAKSKTAVTQAIKKYCNFHGFTFDATSNNIKIMIVSNKQEPTTKQEPPEIWDELNEKAKL